MIQSAVIESKVTYQYQLFFMYEKFYTYLKIEKMPFWYEKKMLGILITLKEWNSYIVWTIMIAVGVCYYGQTRKEVFGAENIPGLHSISDIPNSKTVAIQIFCTAWHTELNLQFPISHSNRLWKKNCLLQLFTYILHYN